MQIFVEAVVENSSEIDRCLNYIFQVLALWFIECEKYSFIDLMFHVTQLTIQKAITLKSN